MHHSCPQVSVLPHWWCPLHRGLWLYDPAEKGTAVPQSSALAESSPVRKGWPVKRRRACPGEPPLETDRLGNPPVQVPGGSTSVWTKRNKDSITDTTKQGLVVFYERCRWETWAWSGRKSLETKQKLDCRTVRTVPPQYLHWSQANNDNHAALWLLYESFVLNNHVNIKQYLFLRQKVFGHWQFNLCNFKMTFDFKPFSICISSLPVSEHLHAGHLVTAEMQLQTEILCVST